MVGALGKPGVDLELRMWEEGGLLALFVLS